MEATLSLNHHFHPQAFSQSTKPSSINNPRLGSGLRRLYHHPSLLSGFSLQATHLETLPSRPYLIKSMSEGDGDKGKMEKKGLKRWPSTRSLTLASLRRDKVALDGMLDAKRALRDPRLLDNGEIEFLNLMEEEKISWDKLQDVITRYSECTRYQDYNPVIQERRYLLKAAYDIQRVVWKLEMSGKEDKAARLLKERYDEEVNKGGALNSYEAGILLAEMMIYQGFYKPARRICNTLLEKRPSTDARPLLYLAVTNVLVGDKMEEAEENWRNFRNLTQDEPATLTFEQFKSHVYILEDEIALK